MGLLMLVARDFLCCRNFPDECFQSLFNPSSLLGFAAAAGLLLPLFTTFNLITNWMMSARVVIAGLRRCWWADDLTAHTGRTFAVYRLIGRIVGLGQLSKNSELTAIRSTGFLSSVLHWWRWLPGYCGLFIRRDR